MQLLDIKAQNNVPIWTELPVTSESLKVFKDLRTHPAVNLESRVNIAVVACRYICLMMDIFNMKLKVFFTILFIFAFRDVWDVSDDICLLTASIFRFNLACFANSSIILVSFSSLFKSFFTAINSLRFTSLAEVGRKKHITVVIKLAIRSLNSKSSKSNNMFIKGSVILCGVYKSCGDFIITKWFLILYSHFEIFLCVSTTLPSSSTML